MNTVNITAPNDADFHRTFLYKVTSTGLGVDLTGVSMKMVLRRHASDVAAQLELTTEDGGIQIIPPALDGRFAILITQAQLEQLPVDTYDQSLVMMKDGATTRIWGGTFTNVAGASR